MKFAPVIFLLIGFLLRIGYAVKGPRLESNLWSDMVIYFKISDQILNGVWKAYHFFQSIGYPLLISGIRLLTPEAGTVIVTMQAFASCLSLFIFYRLSSESLGKKVGLISLIIGAFHFPWILYINYSLPEILFTFFLSLAAWFAWKISREDKPKIRYGVLWACSFILAFWLKGTHAFWGPLFLLALLWDKRQKAIPVTLAICFVVSTGLTIHGILTYKTIGKIQLSASTGGLNFVEGKCPSKVNIDTIGYRWHSPLYYQLDIFTEKKWKKPFTESGYFLRKGLRCIQKDPFVLIQSLESIPYLFVGNTMWPFNRKPESRYTRLYELFFALFLIVGLFSYGIHAAKDKISKIEFTTWVVPIMAIFLCVYVFKSEMRYRIPFDIWLIPVAVKGWLSQMRLSYFEKSRADLLETPQ